MSAVDIQIVITGVVIGSLYALVGLGLAFIFQVTGVYNLAQGGFVVLAGLGYALLTRHGLAAGVALLIVVIAVAGLEAIQGFGMRRWFAPERHSAAVFLTLALGLVIEGLCLVGFGPQAATAPAVIVVGDVRIGGAVLQGEQLIMVIATLLIAVAYWWWFYHARSGLMFRAVVDDETGAVSVGVKVNRVRVLTFAIGGVIAAIAGALIVAPETMSYNSDSNFLVYGLTAMVIGGLGRPLSSLIGGLAVGLIYSFGGAEIGTGAQVPLVLAAVLLVFIVRPRGLFAARHVARRV